MIDKPTVRLDKLLTEFLQMCDHHHLLGVQTLLNASSIKSIIHLHTVTL